MAACVVAVLASLRARCSALLCVGDGNCPAVVVDSVFFENVGTQASGLLVYDTRAALVDSTYFVGNENTDLEHGGGGLLITATNGFGALWTVSRSSFQHNTPQGGVVSTVTAGSVSNSVVIDQCSFTAAHGSCGFQFSGGVDVLVRNSSLRDCMAPEAPWAGFYVKDSDSTVLVEDTTFKDIFARASSALLVGGAAQLGVVRCHFERCRSNGEDKFSVTPYMPGAVDVFAVTNVRFTNVSFVQCTTLGHGGALRLARVAAANVEQALFFQCSAQIAGGAVYGINVTRLTVRDTVFEACSVAGGLHSGGGAISAYLCSVDMARSRFHQNEAYSGGGFTTSSYDPVSDGIVVSIRETIFTENRGLAESGALELWRGLQGYVSGCLFHQNSAANYAGSFFALGVSPHKVYWCCQDGYTLCAIVCDCAQLHLSPFHSWQWRCCYGLLVEARHLLPCPQYCFYQQHCLDSWYEAHVGCAIACT